MCTQSMYHVLWSRFLEDTDAGQFPSENMENNFSEQIQILMIKKKKNLMRNAKKDNLEPTFKQ